MQLYAALHLTEVSSKLMQFNVALLFTLVYNMGEIGYYLSLVDSILCGINNGLDDAYRKQLYGSSV